MQKSQTSTSYPRPKRPQAGACTTTVYPEDCRKERLNFLYLDTRVSRLEPVGEQRVVGIGLHRTDVTARTAWAGVAALVGGQALRCAGEVDGEAGDAGQARRCRAAIVRKWAEREAGAADADAVRFRIQPAGVTRAFDVAAVILKHGVAHSAAALHDRVRKGQRDAAAETANDGADDADRHRDGSHQGDVREDQLRARAVAEADGRTACAIGGGRDREGVAGERAVADTQRRVIFEHDGAARVAIHAIVDEARSADGPIRASCGVECARRVVLEQAVLDGHEGIGLGAYRSDIVDVVHATQRQRTGARAHHGNFAVRDRRVFDEQLAADQIHARGGGVGWVELAIDENPSQGQHGLAAALHDKLAYRAVIDDGLAGVAEQRRSNLAAANLGDAAGLETAAFKDDVVNQHRHALNAGIAAVDGTPVGIEVHPDHRKIAPGGGEKHISEFLRLYDAGQAGTGPLHA